MDTLIAMQDIRDGLATIADRVASGESFIVVRNSRPAFRITPLVASAAAQPRPSKLSAVRKRLADYPVSDDELSPDGLGTIIRDVRARRRKSKAK